jgi:hypothetical protein
MVPMMLDFLPLVGSMSTFIRDTHCRLEEMILGADRFIVFKRLKKELDQ